MFPRVVGIFGTFLRAFDISIFLILFKYLKFSVSENYKILEKTR
jgi:hypothetical protein